MAYNMEYDVKKNITTCYIFLNILYAWYHHKFQGQTFKHIQT
jgi:hypothetical protein